MRRGRLHAVSHARQSGSLEFRERRKRFDAGQLQTICTNCNPPLLARCDLDKTRPSLEPRTVYARSRGLWRMAEIPPGREENHFVTLGQGNTPLATAEVERWIVESA